MKKEKLKFILIPVLYVVAVFGFVSSMFFIQKKVTDMVMQEDDQNFEYVSQDNVLDETKPVVEVVEKVVNKPYLDNSINIIKNFYDYKAEASIQEKSLVLYENTYMQNSGVDYQGANPNFEVTAIMDGTVINVSEDDLLGKYVEVRHGNDLISVYQCLSETLVTKDANITQNTPIGKSGTCNIDVSLGDHLHFELIYKGQMVNPEEYYNKKITELQ